ncbi:MAG: UbiA family prenyltransferase [Flavobacterium sp.]|nr:UbiA family prenyltransferase [Flavobacterium sp.]
MTNYLKLIRYRHLLVLAFLQLIFRFGFLKLQNIPLSLGDWQYLLLVLSTVCLAAGGAIVNAIFQQDSDSENQPEFQVIGKYISENTAYNLYAGFTFIGVSIGFYLSNVIQKPNFAILFILIASTLYFYASSMKNSILVGNIIIAFVNSIYLLIIGLFDLLPSTFEGNQTVMGIHFSILIDYAIFTFIICFLIELVSDIKNTNGDKSQGLSTLAIVIGTSKAKKVALVISLIPIFCVLYYLKVYLFDAKLLYSFIYGLIFIVMPLIYFSIKILKANDPKEIRHLYLILNWILVLGYLSILVIILNIRYNA